MSELHCDGGCVFQVTLCTQLTFIMCIAVQLVKLASTAVTYKVDSDPHSFASVNSETCACFYECDDVISKFAAFVSKWSVITSICNVASCLLFRKLTF
jgi:hypothetical protein